MKKYVKISSGIIVSVLSLTDLIGIVLLAICVVLDLNMLLGIPPLDEAEGLGFFDSLLGPPVHLFLFVVLIISILVLIAECILKLLLYKNAVSREDYGRYQLLSILCLAELIVNAVLVWIDTSIAVNLDGIYSAQEAAMEKGLLIWFQVYVVTGVLTILDVIFVSICVKEEKAMYRR